ncbi:MAG TPA: aldo/keto reductase [Dehalococcoidia bacterium]|nr:aldo/keto reductase [Dehalococcoidia bacterium]
MDVRRLGRSGLKVSALCLGTMTFGNQADEEPSFAIMDKAYEAGIFFFDSADVYPVVPRSETWGRSEQIVGNWLRNRGLRERVVLATKARGTVGPGPNDAGLSRKHLLDAIDASLRRLQTEYVDLYQVHAFDPETPLDETLRALDEIVRSGRARYLGCSNFAAWQLARALWISDKQNLARFDSVQPRYNLLDRRIEDELLPLCRDQGVGVIPYSPIAGGLLTGKYGAGREPDANARYILFGRQAQITPQALAAIDGLTALAREHDATLAQFAVAWVAAQPGVTAPIIGATRPEQLDETLGAVKLKLDEETLHRATAIARAAGA